MKEEGLRKAVSNIKTFDDVKKEHDLDLVMKTIKAIVHEFNEIITVDGCQFKKELPKLFDRDFFKVLENLFIRKGWNLDISRRTNDPVREYTFRFTPAVKYKKILEKEKGCV